MSTAFRVALIGAAIVLWFASVVSCTSRSQETRPPQVQGDAAWQNVVDALEDGDIETITSLLSFKPMPCGIAVDGDGPRGKFPGPACKAGESEGTVVAVLPIVGCEVDFVRPSDAPAAVRRLLLFGASILRLGPAGSVGPPALPTELEVYAAIKLRRPIWRSQYRAFEDGFYGVVAKTGQGRLGVMLSVSWTGAIVNLWPGCGEFAAGLIDDRFGEQLLFKPD